MRRTAWRLLAIASLLQAAAAATRPHYGGTLRVEMQARPASIEPGEFAAQPNLAALAFDRLVTWSDTAQPQSALAISWRHDAEFKRWEFQLRPGVKFHDGSAFTAAAAAAALEKTGASAQGETLVIRSEQPTPKLLESLADAGQSIWKRSADGALAGTGPFRLQSWEPGRRAVFAANDDYWAGRPYLDTIEIQMGRTPRDQALDFDLNKADLVELSPADVRRVQQSARKTWTSAPVDLAALVFDPAVDARVREAVALSIDRTSLGVLLQRQGAPTAALLPQWLTGYAFLFQAERDLDRARQIAPRVTAPVAIAYDPQDTILRAIAERIAVNAREAGVMIQPVAASQIAAARMVRARIASPNAGDALSGVATALGTARPALGLYESERALLQDYRIVPLFHLPAIYGLGARIRSWSATRWGAWKLDGIWLAPEKP